MLAASRSVALTFVTIISVGCDSSPRPNAATRAVAESDSTIELMRSVISANRAPRFSLPSDNTHLLFRADIQEAVAAFSGSPAWVDGKVIDLVEVDGSYHAVAENLDLRLASREIDIVLRFLGLSKDVREQIRAKRDPYMMCLGRVNMRAVGAIALTPFAANDGTVQIDIGPPPAMIDVECQQVVVVDEPIDPSDAWKQR